MKLSPKLALPIGSAITSIGITLTLFHPFGHGDALDAAQGLIVGLGFGITIAGFLKGRRAGTL